MVYEQLIPQLFGLISFGLGAIGFMQKDDHRFKLFLLLLNINHTLHFVLMDALTSAFCSFISMGRTLTSMKTKSKYVACFFILITVLISPLWAEYWYDWLCVVGVCIGTYGLFCLSGIKLRLVMMVGTLCWLANNILVGSIGGVMLETMVLVINIVTISRLYRAKVDAFAS